VADLIAAHRLVTLSGAPGVGKTRLGLRVATEVRDRFSDGVWLVELAALTEPALVASMAVSTLNLREDARQASVETLRDHFRARRALLILDNCEHVLDACAALIVELLRACADLQVLATSREPLGASVHDNGPLASDRGRGRRRTGQRRRRTRR
jgi:non-specific serine/threonine protein kinase